jgi:hypothetical protein
MRKLVGVSAVLLLHWLAAAGAAHAASVVLVAEDGGFDAPTVQTVRTIAATELRARGVAVTDDPRYHTTVPLTDELLRGLVEQGVARLFVLRLGPLGAKVVISMEEVQPPEVTPRFVATLTAETIEESDTVVPRLVRAVLDRVPPEKTASIATVTAQESQAFRKKPGDGLFTLGLCAAPLGGSVGWSYEAHTWRLGALFQGARDDPPYFGLEGAWVPGEGEVSPYVGAGLGVVWPASGAEGEAKLGAKLDLGAEFFRLRGVRLLVGASAVIPFESMPGTDDFNAQLWVRLGL